MVTRTLVCQRQSLKCNVVKKRIQALGFWATKGKIKTAQVCVHHDNFGELSNSIMYHTVIQFQEIQTHCMKLCYNILYHQPRISINSRMIKMVQYDFSCTGKMYFNIFINEIQLFYQGKGHNSNNDQIWYECMREREREREREYIYTPADQT